MNISKIRVLSLLIIIAMLVGGVTSIVAAQNAADSPQATAEVQFGHLAPFDADLDNTSVTLRVDGEDVFTDLKFGEPAPQSPFLDYPAGDHLVEIIPTGSAAPILSETLTWESGEKYAVSLIGNGTTQALELFQLVDDTIPVETHAKLKVVNVAPIAGDIDICTDDGTLFMGLSDLSYKDFNDPYLLLTEGEYDLMVATSGSSCADVLYDIPSLWFRIDQIADLYVTGDNDNQPMVEYSYTGLVYTKKGYIRFAQYSLFTDDPADSNVTLRVDGGDVRTDFGFKEVTAYLDLDPGEHLVEIYENGTTNLLASSTVDLDYFTYYTSGIIGDDVNQPIEIYTLEDDVEVPDTGSKLRIVHAAPIASDLENTRIDICTHEGTIFEGLSNIPYKYFTDPYLEIDAGNYDLYVTEPGSNCQDVLFDIPAFGLAELGIYDMWLIDHWDVGWPDPPLPVPVPYLNLANVAPFEEDYNLTGITIIIDGIPVVTDFRFLKFSGYTKFLPGEHNVTIKQTATGIPMATGTIDLAENEYYTLHLIGDGDYQPIEIFFLMDDVVPLPDAAKLRIVHVAPIATDLNDTLADVCTFENQIFNGQTNLPYKSYSDPYLQVAPGYYRLKATHSGTNCQDLIAGLSPYLLDAGDVGSLYIFGDTKYPRGQITWPDLSAYMLFLDIVGIEFTQ
ncbi:MAG: DUF4397 domain-containing protein [Chloroflexota bacterium]|nr:DUF4397 domain-containing protein [Chloroflexota bacterium]